MDHDIFRRIRGPFYGPLEYTLDLVTHKLWLTNTQLVNAMFYKNRAKGESYQFLASVNENWDLILQDNVPKRIPTQICSSRYIDKDGRSINDDEYLWLNNLTRDETELFLSSQRIGSFVIRKAESKIDQNHIYSLSIKSKSTLARNIMHYPILRKQKRNDFS